MPQSAIDPPTPEPSLSAEIMPEELLSKTIKTDQLISVVDDLFRTMLELPIQFRSEQVGYHDASDGERSIVQASIRIDGDWQADVHVISTQQLSEQIACAMFDCDADTLSEEEILDAVGEVVNVIGGNLKGIIDQECNLSLPCVAAVASYENEAGSASTFAKDDQTLTVVLIEA